MKERGQGIERGMGAVTVCEHLSDEAEESPGQAGLLSLTRVRALQEYINLIISLDVARFVRGGRRIKISRCRNAQWGQQIDPGPEKSKHTD